MSLRSLLSVGFLLVTAPTAALAQEAPPAVPAPALAPEVVAFDARVAAYEERIAAMETEMQAAVAAAAGDTARRDAALDAILARYQPEADAFAEEVSAFINGRAALAPEPRRPAMLEAARVMSQQARLAPRMIRDGLARPSAAAPTRP